MDVHSVIFDLDGTLIDSAPSILASMKAVFDEAGIEPTRQLTNDLIGPPLAQILTSLLTDATIGELPRLIKSFKCHYDNLGYRETRVYQGVSEMLTDLKSLRLRLYIATNKRILPTRRIIEYIGWIPHFDNIYALDSFEPNLLHKTAMLQCLRLELPSGASGLIYVGDRPEDAEAANRIGLPFIWADWGYGNCNPYMNNCFFARKPENVVSFIVHGQ